MLAYPRKPSDDESPVAVELLLADADDDLAPLTPPARPKRELVEPRAMHGTQLVAAPRFTSEQRAAYVALAAFASSGEPQVGWRRWLVVVTGICLVPSRSERELRSRIALLVRSVDPALIDDEKEAAS